MGPWKTAIPAGLVLMFSTAVLLAPVSDTSAGTAVIRVRDEAQLAAAVAALRDSGGTIVLARGDFDGELLVPARSTRPLRIVAEPGARVERILLEDTQRVTLGPLTIAPRTQDARLEVRGSNHVVVHDVVVRATGTRYSASVLLSGSRDVTIRRSVFTHCGDRSLAWSNCLQLKNSSRSILVEDNWFHDCYGCDFIHGRFDANLIIRGNRFQAALPCRIESDRCRHQDLVQLFAGRNLLVERNVFGTHRGGAAQLYLTGAIDRVRIVDNVFAATDPRVPGYRVRVGIIIGRGGSGRLPNDVRVLGNTIVSGVRRADGYAGSIRMSSRYGGVPLTDRPILANNVIGLLEVRKHVCSAIRRSVSNVVLHGRRCSPSDRVGPAHLDRHCRPTAASKLLIDRATPRYGPPTDFMGRPRGAAPDIGAFEYVAPRSGANWTSGRSAKVSGSLFGRQLAFGCR
jgi:Right handed beta helix region